MRTTWLYMMHCTFCLPKISASLACVLFDTKHETVYWKLWLSDVACFFLSWKPARITLCRLSSAVRQIPARSRDTERDLSNFAECFSLLWFMYFPRTTWEMWQHCSALTSQIFPTTTMWRLKTLVEGAPRHGSRQSAGCDWCLAHSVLDADSFSSCVYA